MLKMTLSSVKLARTKPLWLASESRIDFIIDASIKKLLTLFSEVSIIPSQQLSDFSKTTDQHITNMPSPKVIVFGPTGAVGSAAARTAHSMGADVTLAMRDTSKTIPGLDTSLPRVQADLTDPSTISAAVKQSGAPHAFFYLVFRTPDHMLSTIQALKDSGIKFVVFLSSFTVSGDLKAIQPIDAIDYAHAQVELNLESVFGRENFVALRPGSFASNELQYVKGFKDNDVKITMPHSKVDCIVPADIGRVGGTILAQGPPKDGNHAIYLYGPHFISAKESVATIAKVLGKEPPIRDVNENEARRVLIEETGYPPPLADYFIRQTSKAKNTGAENEIFGKTVNMEDRGNVAKYGGGGRATTFEEYVRENREKFEA